MNDNHQRYSPEHRFTEDEQARFDNLEQVIMTNGWEIYTQNFMRVAMGGLLRHADSRKSITTFLDGISVSDAAQEVIAGAMTSSHFMECLHEAWQAAPDVPKPRVDHRELWRRDLVHYGPNPMNATMEVRLYYEPSKDHRYGILRFRPEGFAYSTGADERD